MKQQNKEIDKYRIKNGGAGNNGAYLVPIYETGAVVVVISSDGMGWDHVSVSLKNRCPKWEEMAYIKDLFFDADETVVQFHPKKEKYVNNHSYCLHLWKKQGADFELPESIMV